MGGNQNNFALRQMAKESGVYFWQIAQLWGVSEAYMTRLFRKDLAECDRNRFIDAIAQLKQEQA